MEAPPILTTIVLGIIAVLVIVGLILVVSSFVGRGRRVKMLAVGVVLLVTGAGVFFVTSPSHQNSISVGDGSVLVSTSYFDLNVSAVQITKAFVVNLSTWNVTVSARTDGSAFGQFLSGYFALSNGAKADILSAGDTNLVLVLQSGTYVILGPQDFPPFITTFDRSVLPVPGG